MNVTCDVIEPQKNLFRANSVFPCINLWCFCRTYL